MATPPKKRKPNPPEELYTPLVRYLVLSVGKVLQHRKLLKIMRLLVYKLLKERILIVHS